jgi:hypothetical protein
MAQIKFKRFEEPDEWGNRCPAIGVYTEAIHWMFVCLRAIAQMPDASTPNEIWVTSINDSLHSKGSRHYLNEAMDIRSKNFPTIEAKRYFVKRLSSILNSHPDDPNKFFVMLEFEGGGNEHFHVQVRKGISFMLL